MAGVDLIDIDITDEASLIHVCRLLHDAFCDVNAAVYDLQRGTWDGVFRRLSSNGRVIKQGLIWDRLAIPLMETELNVRNISSLEIEDRSGIGTYSFGGCVSSRNGYELQFNEGLSIRLLFDGSPQGRLHDIRALDLEDTSVHVLHRRRESRPP